jgi:RsiW-degrading membrane proteinase PrsW (M82 family)
VISSLVPIPLSLFPILVFLVLLFFMDTFKLLPKSAILRALAAGALAAVLCYFVSASVLTHTSIPGTTYKRYLAPLIEESLKAAYIVLLIRTARVGFLVDACISGFAVGTGFALVENVNYLLAVSAPNLLLWVVRGFGTAVMHGSTTAVFAMLGLSLSERHPSAGPVVFLPGFAIAYAVHSSFNHFGLHPLVMTALLLIALPLLVVLVFERSERATRHWLGVGFDTDVELLEILNGKDVADSRVGRHLADLQKRLPGNVVADLLCLLRVHLELSVRAKGILLARAAGIPLEPDHLVRANLEELDYLNASVGRTGRLAVAPFLNMTRRELWQLYMLSRAGRRAAE